MLGAPITRFQVPMRDIQMVAASHRPQSAAFDLCFHVDEEGIRTNLEPGAVLAAEAAIATGHLSVNAPE